MYFCAIKKLLMSDIALNNYNVKDSVTITLQDEQIVEGEIEYIDDQSLIISGQVYFDFEINQINKNNEEQSDVTKSEPLNTTVTNEELEIIDSTFDKIFDFTIDDWDTKYIGVIRRTGEKNAMAIDNDGFKFIIPKQYFVGYFDQLSIGDLVSTKLGHSKKSIKVLYLTHLICSKPEFYELFMTYYRLNDFDKCKGLISSLRKHFPDKIENEEIHQLKYLLLTKISHNKLTQKSTDEMNDDSFPRKLTLLQHTKQELIDIILRKDDVESELRKQIAQLKSETSALKKRLNL